MNISPTEAEEALEVIQSVANKTRRSIAEGGTYITLIITGVVWLIGFMATQFLPYDVVGYIWTGLCVLGTILGYVLGSQRGKRLRSPDASLIIKRVGIFWLLLILFGISTIVITRPADGKQAVMLIVLFIMLGQMSMGLIFSFSSVWWTLPITALALIGYFLFPDIYYLWMSILGGGGMIVYGLYIRSRW
jgi:hypothetical protein